jgi:hypothetical protein
MHHHQFLTFGFDLFSISPKRDLTNVILTGTLVGGSLYLMQRPHLAAVEDPKKKILLR